MGFKGESVLVTGGAGFIGSNLVLRLVEAGAKVTVLDAMVPDCGGNLFNLRPVEKDIEFVRGDLRHASNLPAVIEGKRFIFNLAGFISHQDSLDIVVEGQTALAAEGNDGGLCPLAVLDP